MKERLKDEVTQYRDGRKHEKEIQNNSASIVFSIRWDRKPWKVFKVLLIYPTLLK